MKIIILIEKSRSVDYCMIKQFGSSRRYVATMSVEQTQKVRSIKIHISISICKYCGLAYSRTSNYAQVHIILDILYIAVFGS